MLRRPLLRRLCSSAQPPPPAHWPSALAAVRKASARAMLPRLKRSDPLGVDTALRGASAGKGTVYDFALGVRAVHPSKVLLIRVGDFYEAFGYCAVMLVEHAGVRGCCCCCCCCCCSCCCCCCCRLRSCSAQLVLIITPRSSTAEPDGRDGRAARRLVTHKDPCSCCSTQFL